MPVPETGFDQLNPNTPLWTFDDFGNLNLAGVLTTDAPLSPNGRTLLPGTAGQGGSLTNGLAPSGDATGVKDTANIQGMINLGAVVVPLAAGTFTMAPEGLTPVTGIRLTGQGYEATTIVSTTGSIINAGNIQTEDVEIDHLTLEATGFDLITGANCVRWKIHDCQLWQNSAANAIWNAQSVTLLIDSVFEKNVERVYAPTARTIDAWYLASASSAHAVNANVWRDNVCFNENQDPNEYWYHLIQSASNQINLTNSFQHIVFETPCGGCILVESGFGTTIDDCWSYDTTSNTIANNLFAFKQNATGGTPRLNRIRNSGRIGAGLESGVYDISLDVHCTSTTIDSCGATNANPLQVNVNGATGVKFINIPASATVTGIAATAVAGAGAGTSPPGPVAAQGPGNQSGTITWGTGSSAAAGTVVTVTFGTPFNAAPTVVVSATNGPSSAIEYYVTAVSATGFSVATGANPASSQGNTHYGFAWYASDT
jgi:hypothetical protein